MSCTRKCVAASHFTFFRKLGYRVAVEMPKARLREEVFLLEVAKGSVLLRVFSGRFEMVGSRHMDMHVLYIHEE